MNEVLFRNGPIRMQIGDKTVTVDKSDLTEAERVLLDDNSNVRILSAAVVHALPAAGVRLFLHLNGIYGLPTTELVEFLKVRIGGRHAIEIGAGTGLLGKALGIPMTDSHLQADPKMTAFYLATGQPPICYGKDVQKLDALAAIEFHKPTVVVGSWITQFSNEIGKGSSWGIDEEQLLRKVPCYLMYGGITSHKDKTILAIPHLTWTKPWMCGRAQDPVLYQWGP